MGAHLKMTKNPPPEANMTVQVRLAEVRFAFGTICFVHLLLKHCQLSEIMFSNPRGPLRCAPAGRQTRIQLLANPPAKRHSLKSLNGEQEVLGEEFPHLLLLQGRRRRPWRGVPSERQGRLGRWRAVCHSGEPCHSWHPWPPPLT